MGRALRRWCAAAALALAPLPAGASGGDQPAWRAPGARDRCPVCGMFVARFPAWTAGLALPDGSWRYFDGVKDLVRHLAEEPPGSVADAAPVIVTDYYDLEPTDGRAAWYVSGSDILGPMGREFIPFAHEKEAREFLRDHRGTGIHRFGDLPGLLEANR